jgi:threonine synthase
MKYTSTRGRAEIKNFADVATSGLASDGGLYCPEKIPTFSIEEIKSWKNLPYTDLAFKIIAPFVDGEIADADLKEIIKKSYKNFRVDDVTEIKKLDENLYVLELFHGPTLAFKDVALQFLGQVQDFILSKTKQNLVIIGATSGDTGSAAIEGVRNCKHVQLFMMHPYGKVSEVQRRQMTSVVADNIHNIAVDGFFDDCQNMVKAMFESPEFMGNTRLSAVNSINWARIMAQIVYYFQTSLKICGAEKPISFAVPSGNLGDILAGYVAKRMGLPVNLLIATTNENDILCRFFEKNDYSKQGVKPTVAPSMDIQISSNFERLLAFEYNDAKIIDQKMQDFKTSGKLSVDGKVFDEIRSTFRGHASNDAEIKAEIKRVYDKYNYIVCPHTATGTRAAEELNLKDEVLVVLATAHPAKFPDVVKESINVHPALPEHLKDLLSRKEEFVRMPNNIEEIKKFIAGNSK